MLGVSSGLSGNAVLGDILNPKPHKTYTLNPKPLNQVIYMNSREVSGIGMKVTGSELQGLGFRA